MVSPIAFGAFKIGRNEGIKYSQGYELPTADEAARLLHGLLDAGVNYIDTAPAYGCSEEYIGRALAERRGEFVLSTKVGETFEQGRSRYDFSRAAVEGSVRRSLTRLRTDFVDILFVHAPADDLAVLEQTDVVETLQGLRAAGMTRWVGFSGKTTAAEGRALLWADVLMVELNLNDRAHEPVIAAAGARDVGVVVKKGLGAGRLDPDESIRMVLGTPGVCSLVVGSLNLEHIRANMRIAAALEAAADAERSG